MRNEYEIDCSVTPVVLAVSQADASITIPAATNNPISSQGHTGSLFFISIDGNPISIKYGGTAVFGTDPVFEVGSYLTQPLNIPPGTVVHAIAASGKTATLSLIRAWRR